MVSLFYSCLRVEDPYNLHIKSKSDQKAATESRKGKSQKSQITFGPLDPPIQISTEREIKARLGWVKLAKATGRNRMPLGPRTSIAVPHASETMRSEILQLMNQ
jgi:hypothetical protein